MSEDGPLSGRIGRDQTECTKVPTMAIRLPDRSLEMLHSLEDSYLSESDLIRQSGFGGGAERWRIERGLILDAVDDDGDFLDVGCANGYLLGCLVAWAREREIMLTPYGVDIGPRLIALAKERLPQHAANFWIADACEWIPPRKFRYVYTLWDCVPVPLLSEYLRRLMDRCVEPDGRLIVGAYGSNSRREPARDVARDLAAAGLTLAGDSLRGALPVSRVAWTHAGQSV
jgi:SAM-dependent methyltransferase